MKAKTWEQIQEELTKAQAALASRNAKIEELTEEIAVLKKQLAEKTDEK